jgi:hypothetical protein
MLLFSAQGFSSPKTLGKFTTEAKVLLPTHRGFIAQRRLQTSTESEWDFRMPTELQHAQLKSMEAEKPNQTQIRREKFY